jgi:16S rRNA (cytosine1402-N4)-methyltransferase
LTNRRQTKERDELHVPVMLDEAVRGLSIIDDGVYVDVTYGRGGHALAILEHLGSDGCLVALDRDPQAVEHARKTIGGDPRCRIAHGAMKDLDKHLKSMLPGRKANGVIADLGVSSAQLDDPRRGFSFQADGPLDMRMDPSAGLDAATWLNRAEEADLVRVLRDLGEERYARRIARAIAEHRRAQPLRSTAQLANIVSGAVPTREKNKHPATRTFQAVRMYINSELDQLSAFLPKALGVLAAGGRLVVISFHSLEDRLVKRFMRKQARGDDFPPGVPVAAGQLKPLLKVIGKPTRPGRKEVEYNPRARSAVLRIAERTEVCCA